ncbi:uncharacterized protein LOC143649767 isoform X3 [Tamandua tetradactyla]|uniref:uncharacterized protein LOC143649767 isoform X3 n=1 Tax=Tamandua tetradactyla TaxID=48850 RepID=UPI0040538282
MHKPSLLSAVPSPPGTAVCLLPLEGPIAGSPCGSPSSLHFCAGAGWHALIPPDVVPGFRHPRPFPLWAAWMPPIHVDLQLLGNVHCLQTLCTEDTMHTVWAADTTEDMKRIFHKIHDDCKVMLQLEKKLFDFFNREVFRDKNTTMTENLQKNWLREFHQVSCFSGCCLLVPPAPLGSAAGPQLLILTSLCWWCCFRAVRPAERRCRHHLEVPVGTPRREAGVDAGFMSQLSAWFQLLHSPEAHLRALDPPPLQTIPRWVPGPGLRRKAQGDVCWPSLLAFGFQQLSPANSFLHLQISELSFLGMLIKTTTGRNVTSEEERIKTMYWKFTYF